MTQDTPMPDGIRFKIAMETAREILVGLGCDAGADDAVLLGKAAYAVLDAIYRAEGELAACGGRLLCPRCFRSYPVPATLPGREIACHECGHRWRTPDAAERN